MVAKQDILKDNCRKFVLIGEAGSGKTEIAVNIAALLARSETKPVDFFDLDMTKPLFRSRDLEQEMEALGIKLCYQEQFMDSPAIAAGIRAKLRDEERYCVLDVGGGSSGARFIGSYRNELNKDDTAVFCVLNPYRPWSGSREEIMKTLSEIVSVSGLEADRIQLIANPNIGNDTELSIFLEGMKVVRELLGTGSMPAFSCVREALYYKLSKEEKNKVFPLKLYLRHY